MKRHWRGKLLASAMVLALVLPVPGFGEAPEESVEPVEVVELDLIDLAAFDGASGESASRDAGDVQAPAQGDAADDPARDGGENAEGEAVEIVTQSAEPTSGEGAAEQPASADLRLGVGERYALRGATQSDRPEVASVDAGSGMIVAHATGVARITVAGSGGAAQSCVVEVLKAPDQLSFAASKLTLGVGEKRTLAARLPKGTASAGITYASGNKSVVSVDDKGNLRAKKAGTAKITAKAYNGAKAVCTVKVAKAPSKVTLSASRQVLCVAESATLKAKLPSKSASKIKWTSSNPAVVTVNASGKLKGVGAGKATVWAAAFNGKKASCKVTVLAGSAPTTLSAGVGTITLGVKEKYALKPSVGAGESAAFSFSSKKKKIASVSGKGVITGKKKGKTWITVRTHNGLKAVIKVKVVKAPARVTLSRSSLSMRVGETEGLSAWVPSGSASAIAWSSSDASVASVDDDGKITALKPGKAVIRAKTYNEKSKSCAVTVVAEDDDSQETTGEDTTMEDPDGESDEAVLSGRKMVANLRASGSLGSKKTAIANVVELLMANGFEPAFAAGVGANIYAEGSYGLFESSRYVTNPKKRPRYFCYLDGGEYYTSKNGGYALVAVYMSQEEMRRYTGKAEARLRFDEENFYLDNYSRRYAQDVDLNELEALMERLADGGWEGKFGLGIVQWTGARTRTLVSFYRKHAGENASAITAAQVVAAENEMILYDFKGSYSSVYAAWKSANRNAPGTADAARSAGALVCTRYEIPADKESKAVTRGNKAVEIFNIMTGEK